ncbi:MAG: hypothetical protein ABIG92_07645 [Candidatus Omnitrophota bacterium]
MSAIGLKKEQIEYIVIVIVIIIALFMAITKFSGKDDILKILFRSDFDRKMDEIKAKGLKLPEDKEEVLYSISKDKTPFRSPFDLLEKGEVSLPSIQLQGMIWNSTRPQAIINDKAYDVNDVISTGEIGDGIRIVDITEKGIHLKYKGKFFTVRPSNN